MVVIEETTTVVEEVVEDPPLAPVEEEPAAPPPPEPEEATPKQTKSKSRQSPLSPARVQRLHEKEELQVPVPPLTKEPGASTTGMCIVAL